jgi:hypothetical protein
LSGIAFVALWIGGFAVSLVDEPGDSDAEILTYYADDGNRGGDQIGFFLALAACLFFLWFLTVLRARLAGAEGKAGPYTALGFGAGLVATALWIVASVFFMAVSYTAQETPEFKVDPNTERLISEMGYLLFVVGTPVAGVLVLATSLLGLKARLVPRWLSWLGFPIAALMILAFLAVIPFLIFLAWVLVVSIVLLWKPAKQAASAATPAG